MVDTWNPASMFRPEQRRPRRLGTPWAEVQRLEGRTLLDGAARSLLPALSAPSPYGSLEEFRQALIEAAVAMWQGTLGTRFPIYGSYDPGRIRVGIDDLVGGDAIAILAATPPSAGQAAEAATRHSDTNTQVSGVDEQDIVETDGQFLYILTGRTLKIVDARDPSALALASTTTLAHRPIAEFLVGDRLTIISQTDSWWPMAELRASPGRAGVAALFAPDWSYAEPQVVVTEFDVSDRAAPKALRETTLDGSFVEARAVGDRVFVILQSGLYDLMPAPEVTYTDKEGIYETEEQYRARLEAIDVAAKLPGYAARSFDAQGQATGERAGAMVDPAALYKPQLDDDSSLVTIAVFDADSPEPGPARTVTAVSSYVQNVYMNAEHLYLANTQWTWAGTAGDESGQSLILRQFAIGGDTPAMTAVGAVPGTSLNQFSIDEHEGVLRVATTLNGWSPAGSNNVYTLRASDGILSIVGRVEGLAPGEQIYSVRFLGDRAFVVTFRQVDPLFALDLSDPAAPVVVGELKIPGFSRYLHPIDSTHLIGIGRDVDPVTNRTRGLQVSLFDVSDLANPRRVDVETIAGGWSGSEFDHHAVTYFAETGTLAIPVDVWDFTVDRAGAIVPGSALWVFQVDAATGLTVAGQVRHESTVQRAVVIDEAIFSITDHDVRASALADPSRALGELTIREPGEDEGWGGPIIALPLPVETGRPGRTGGDTDRPVAKRPAGQPGGKDAERAKKGRAKLAKSTKKAKPTDRKKEQKTRKTGGDEGRRHQPRGRATKPVRKGGPGRGGNDGGSARGRGRR